MKQRQVLIIYHWDYQGADYAIITVGNNESIQCHVTSWAADEAVHCNNDQYDLWIDHVIELQSEYLTVIEHPIETWKQSKESA